MKRSTSTERETPKKRRKSRLPFTTSPASRGPATPSPSQKKPTTKSMSISEARASSELLQKAMQSRKMDSRKESSPTAHAALGPAVELLETPPASSPPENLESVVQKLPSSSGSADMEMSDDDAALRENTTSSRDAAPSGKRDEEEPEEDDGNETLMNIGEPPLENKAGQDADLTETVDLEIVAPKTPEPKASPDDTMAEDVAVIPTPRQGSGASAEDAMELDPSPSEQLEQEHQLSQQVPSSEDEAPDKLGTIVNSTWLLDKLAGLTPETLSSGRAAIIQELHGMEAEFEQLPRAEMQSRPYSGNPAAQRLHMIEGLMAAQLAKLPAYVWRAYKSKLLRLCAGSAIHNMDHRQRLEKVKEIVYMPEEIVFLCKGDAERIACAVRVCATVTEILGRDDEMVPEEMAEWVAAQLKDLAWKAKVTSAWRRYWPDAEDMAVA